MLETVCIVVASLLSHSVAITGFLERFSPMLAKKAFITGLLFLRPEQRECSHVVLVAQFEVFSLGLLHRRESSNTLQRISQIRFFHGRSLLSLSFFVPEFFVSGPGSLIFSSHSRLK